MFEFGRDLRKLFTQARESDDLGWLELVGVDLVEAEARQQTTDAGRISCAHPFEAGLRASAFWREHARRTGRNASVDKARRATFDAAKVAVNDDEIARARLEEAEIDLLRFDLYGGPEGLSQALADLAGLPQSRRTNTSTIAAGLHARLKARQARLTGTAHDLLDAAALLDAALHAAGRNQPVLGDEIRMDRAALALEAGVVRRDPRLLDQAGRDLHSLVESASPDYRPLTRARALALCGTGMKALALLARDDTAMQQGQELFDAAADQFTPDHSPLDWVAIQMVGADDRTPLSMLAQAQALSEGQGLVLGMLAREQCYRREAKLAEARHDLDRLEMLAATLRRRLVQMDATGSELDWAADQIALAHIALSRGRITGRAPAEVRMTLVEAAATAREGGVPILAERAESLMAEPLAR